MVLADEMPSRSAPAPVVVFCTARPVLSTGAMPTRKLPRFTGPPGVARPWASTVLKPVMFSVCVATLPKLLTAARLWLLSAPPPLPAASVTIRSPLLAPARMGPKLAATVPVPLRRASVRLPRPGPPVCSAPRMSAPVPLLAIWKVRVATVPPRTLPKSTVKVLAPPATTWPVKVCDALLPMICPAPATPARAAKLLPLPKLALV